MAKKIVNIDNWMEYGIDISNRIIDLNADIDSESIAIVNRAIIKMSEVSEEKPIHLFINSFGGSVYDGLALIDLMESLETPIYTYAIGCVMSMGAYIFLMGDYRYGFKRSTYMLHSVSDELEGKNFQIKTDTKEVDRLNNILLDILTEKTSKTKKFWTKAIQYEDQYYDSTKAEKYDIIDEVLIKFQLGE